MPAQQALLCYIVIWFLDISVATRSGVFYDLKSRFWLVNYHGHVPLLNTPATH